MKLIPEAKTCHRLWSLRFAIAAALFGAIELTLPIWQGVVPDSVFATLSTLCAAAAAVARVIRQGALHVSDSD